MAKTKDAGVNKSAKIREKLKANRKMPAKEVVATLAAEGVEVKPSLVYLIKSTMKNKRSKQKRAMVTKVTGSSDPVQLVRKVRTLAEEAGGMKKLRELLDVLEK